MSIYKQTMEIIGRDGIMGMYKGLFISNCGIAPFIGIKMASFDMCVGLTIGKGPDAQKNIPKKKLVYLNLINGAIAGTVAVTLTYPSDLVRRMIQLNGTHGHDYTGIVDCCKQLYTREGFGGFYKGLWATYLKVIPMVSILFLTNEYLKRVFQV